MAKREDRFGALALCLVLAQSFWVLNIGAHGARSQNKQYELVADSERERMVVYRLTSGRREKLYAIPGVLEGVFLTNDGQYVASCEHWLNKGYGAKEIVVRFYQSGRPTANLRLKDVVKRVRKLQREGSRFRWGQCTGFTGDHRFEVYTTEAKRVVYDLRTGAIHAESGPPPLRTGESEVAVNAIPKPDICKTGGYSLCDRFVEYKAGWRQVRGKWEFNTDNNDALLHQKSDRGREGNALMYFDNLAIGDADISTVLRMGFEQPQVAIAEDEPRIRIMRRVAGAGVVFRLQDENNFYMFRLAGEEGAVLGKMVSGEWFDLANPRADNFLGEGRFKYGKERWYKLRVRVRADRIQCWIGEWIREGDDWTWREQAVISLRDENFSTGRVGLTTFHVQAQFSALRVDDL